MRKSYVVSLSAENNTLLSPPFQIDIQEKGLVYDSATLDNLSEGHIWPYTSIDNRWDVLHMFPDFILKIRFAKYDLEQLLDLRKNFSKRNLRRNANIIILKH